ncbi:molybdenum cofactor guanylyltransferase [Limosilactobacillus caccae]|uniref:molybdenum cofactor guanylyltransferase n=1 Tax=Limosilactobacillus caccae TaxID=1926284 RepID=UPI0009703328|nr:molybdenum cofactor guanylyltransferase [Limosilactobacillus caccae]
MIGLILAGGQSRRFGTDKALYTIPGQDHSNVQLAVEKLAPFCSTIIVCANAHNQAQITTELTKYQQATVICDQPPYLDHGPLSGIYAASQQFPGKQEYLMVAVDYPYLTNATIRALARHPHRVIATNKHTHYTLAHFSISDQQVAAWLASGKWRLGEFVIDQCHCQPLIFNNAHEFTNLNYSKEQQ